MRSIYIKLIKKSFFILNIFFLVIPLIGCQSRDTSTLEEALVGHWMTKNGHHYYIDKSSIVWVSNDGTKRNIQYNIISSNDRSLMEIKISNRKGIDNLTFSSNRNVFSCYNKTSSVEYLLNPNKEGVGGCPVWNYIDSKTEP